MTDLVPTADGAHMKFGVTCVLAWAQGGQDMEALREPRAKWGEWVGNQDTELPLA